MQPQSVLMQQQCFWTGRTIRDHQRMREVKNEEWVGINHNILWGKLNNVSCFERNP
jgi:hypothetical protein